METKPGGPLASSGTAESKRPHGLLSRIPFIRPSSMLVFPATKDEATAAPQSVSPARAVLQQAAQQQRTRRRKGSLRKVALLGRSGTRGSKDSSSPLTVDTSTAHQSESSSSSPEGMNQQTLSDLEVDDSTPRPSSEEPTASTVIQPKNSPRLDPDSYTSTTDDEDMLQLPSIPSKPLSLSINPNAGLGSYFSTGRGSTQRRRSFHQAKSPLSYSGLTTTPLPTANSEWDYAETEWWGWVVLIVTWLIFVMGMGSCLGIWSWAWDVGKTPYAPPELEDDPTLPIVGYYPALIILTGVMAWVWVFVAWIGMKYFRHAKISGD